MPPKKPFDEEYGRHTSFRPSRESEPPGLPGVKWLLALLVLAVAVIGYDRLHGHGKDAQADGLSFQQVETDAEPDTPLSETPLTEEEPDSMQSGGEQQMAQAAVANKLLAENQKPAETETVVKYEMQKRFNSFVGPGTVNGKAVALLADTGAGYVVIPEKLANQIGLKKGEPKKFETAGGVVNHYATTLDTLTLGPIEIHNVSAFINPAMDKDFILLGMNVLGLLDMKIEQSTLILQQKQVNVSHDFAVEEKFKRPVKECASQGNKFDQQSLKCLRGTQD